MKKMFKFMTIAIIATLLIGCCSSCNYLEGEKESSDTKTQEQTEQLMKEADKAVGMPAIKNFQEKKWMKMIIELRDNPNFITYAYLVNHMTGELVFIGECVGYGMPYSVQYTNPLRIHDVERQGGASEKFEDNGEIQLLPQPDPNGLFMPQGLSATWLLMIDDKGGINPVYVEPEIIVSPIKFHK